MASELSVKPSWLIDLEKALKRNKRDAHNRYFQLATVDSEGWPRVRTVVFRGFADQTGALLFITDLRSGKMGSIETGGKAEACWYFTQSREQFRLQGHLMILDDSVDREAMWSRLSPAAKEQFFWVTPGALLGEGDSVPNQRGVPSTMVLIKLVPESVDHLVLAKEQARQRHTQTGDGWQASRINP
jgi:pyridoxamine 5'-phosphate oxidase